MSDRPVEDPVEDRSARKAAAWAADSAESPADRHGTNPPLPHHRVDEASPRASGVRAHRCPLGRPHSAGHRLRHRRRPPKRLASAASDSPISRSRTRIGGSRPLSRARRTGAPPPVRAPRDYGMGMRTSRGGSRRRSSDGEDRLRAFIFISGERVTLRTRLLPAEPLEPASGTRLAFEPGGESDLKLAA